jgi:hypothetical protein
LLKIVSARTGHGGACLESIYSGNRSRGSGFKASQGKMFMTSHPSQLIKSWSWCFVPVIPAMSEA